MTEYCCECGEGVVTPKGGKKRWYRVSTDIKSRLPDDLLMPTCDACGAQFVTSEIAKDVEALFNNRVKELKFIKKD